MPIRVAAAVPLTRSDLASERFRVHGRRPGPSPGPGTGPKPGAVTPPRDDHFRPLLERWGDLWGVPDLPSG